MSSEITYQDEALAADFSALQQQLAEIRKATLIPEKKILAKQAQDACKKIQKGVRMFKAEVSALTDETQKRVYERKVQEYTENLKAAEREVKEATKPPAQAKVKPVDNAATKLLKEGGEDGSGFTSTEQVLDAGVRVNQDALLSLQRQEQLVTTAEQTGQETLVTLRKQTETITQVDKDLDTLQAELHRAKQDVAWFARQMAGDKCFFCIFFMVLLALVVVISMQVYKSRTEGDPPAVVVTPAPVVVVENVGSAVHHIMSRKFRG